MLAPKSILSSPPGPGHVTEFDDAVSASIGEVEGPACISGTGVESVTGQFQVGFTGTRSEGEVAGVDITDFAQVEVTCMRRCIDRGQAAGGNTPAAFVIAQDNITGTLDIKRFKVAGGVCAVGTICITVEQCRRCASGSQGACALMVDGECGQLIVGDVKLLNSDISSAVRASPCT